MRLPKDIKNLILDYYYSYKVYIAKENLLRELRFSSFFHQVISFYEIYHSITIDIHANTPTPSLETHADEDEETTENL